MSTTRRGLGNCEACAPAHKSAATTKVQWTLADLGRDPVLRLCAAHTLAASGYLAGGTTFTRADLLRSIRT